ncbi:chemotaxis protein CheA [Bacillus solimangrovi]|uniref:Chemotaxis protein CheA n=1 Tax=Bacillus solimangrovi TaxID=1305675 RepID=A0A1E5LB20_9BACI|nr:chemotaxis protein CheA [Bacillus solimangrovi]OEH91281.1 chemotaxis protein CheA [Bacillus solimangrovi]
MENQQYLEVFIDESKEHLQTVNDQLLLLENNPEDMDIVNEIFRSAHTLKGMSATMGFEDLANLTHKMENVLDGIRNHKIVVTTGILDVVFESVDDLEAMVMDIAGGGDGKRDVEDVVNKLKRIENGEEISQTSAKPEVAATAASNIHLNEKYDQFEITVLEQSKEQGFEAYHVTVKLREDCLLKGARVFMTFEVIEQVGEVIKSTPPVDELEEEQFDLEFSVTVVSKESAGDLEKRIMKVSELESVTVEVLNIESLKEAIEEEEVEKVEQAAQLVNVTNQQQQLPTVKKEENNSQKKESEEAQSKSKTQAVSNKTIRVNIERLDILMNLFEELVIDRGRLEQISNDLNNSELHETVERMSRISGDLQNIILNMRMVPVEQVFNRFPRMVRQLARDLGKKINLEIIGADTELDRTVIDEIGDPLVHLIRNAIDHGIETPETRKAIGKSETGTVVLKAYHSGNHVFIEIEDDGAGIDRERVLNKAIERGVITAEAGANLTDKQVYELILASGFSTAEKISDVSGRGVGLDVVKNTIESLSGSVSIDAKQGVGSIFSIQLPLTLSIISVMLVEIQKEKYAIPLSSIIETAIVKEEDILNAHNQKVIDFRGKVVPLVFLNDVFEVPTEKDSDDFYSIVIVRKGDKMAGLVVDSFIGQQEIVLKSLGDYLTNVFAISGATILGNGQVALIIDCNALIK